MHAIRILGRRRTLMNGASYISCEKEMKYRRFRVLADIEFWLDCSSDFIITFLIVLFFRSSLLSTFSL
jgi:hypothetical protein